MNKPLIIICGSTATGKTAYALKLAKEKNGELISADSRQIYKYLDIGTGKDLPENSKFKDQRSKIQIKNQNYSIGYYLINNIPLWLYDVITPDQRFSAVEYARLAKLVIQNIWERGKLPILVGGTGFYIKALTEGFETSGIPANETLRQQLAKLSVEELQQRLQVCSAHKLSTMNHSDRNNPHRLIRAIEIASHKLQPQTTGLSDKKQISDNITYIGLGLERKELYRRIDIRVEKRIEQGIIKEITHVLKKGYGWDTPGLQTIGYKEWKPYFEKKASKEDTIERWKFNEHSYAKRQETWFKKEKRIRWIRK